MDTHGLQYLSHIASVLFASEDSLNNPDSIPHTQSAVLKERRRHNRYRLRLPFFLSAYLPAPLSPVPVSLKPCQYNISMPVCNEQTY